MIDYLVRRYRRHCDRFVVVIHPDAEQAVRRHLDTLNVDYRLRFQARATGMLDAILAAAVDANDPEVENVWITWCDQIGISETTVERLERELESLGTNGGLVLPTAMKIDPYIHLQRDTGGRFTKVLQRREGDEMPEQGENDCGLFAMSAGIFRHELPRFAAGADVGDGTRERNFLPFIPWLAHRYPVRAFAAHNTLESIGVNDDSDAAKVAAILEPFE